VASTSERYVDESDFSFENPRKSCRKIPKVWRNLEEIFKIYDSVRKELHDEKLI